MKICLSSCTVLWSADCSKFPSYMAHINEVVSVEQLHAPPPSTNSLAFSFFFFMGVVDDRNKKVIPSARLVAAGLHAEKAIRVIRNIIKGKTVP